MESVYLRHKSAEFYVTDEGLREIRALVMRCRICGKCKRPYDIDNLRPCVGFNICMECLLKQQNSLTFLEVQSVNDEGEAYYAFVDGNGTVYTSRENSSTEAIADIRYSLIHAGFPVPETYKAFKATEAVRLDSYHMHVIGDLHKSVVVLDYNDYYSKIHMQFLLYKGGSYKELTRRGEGKVLVERARAMLESTKRNGRYWINGREVWTISDGSIFEVVAQLESAIYDISMQFVPPYKPEQVLSFNEMMGSELKTVDADLDQELEATNGEDTQPVQQDAEEGESVRDLGESGRDVEVPGTSEVQAGSDESV